MRGSRPALTSDAYEYAQAGLNIAQGRGAVTYAASVLEVWRLGRDGLPIPYARHDIGTSLLLAGFFQAFGVSDATIGWTSGVFYILLPALAFLLGTRLFPARVALLGAALVLLSPQLVAFAATGLSEVPYAFLLTLAFYLVYRASGYAALALAGATYGALSVVRANALPLLPWFVLFVALQPPESPTPPRSAVGGRWAGIRSAALRPMALRLAAFLGAFALVLAPNAARNQRLMGHPLHSITSEYSSVFSTSAIDGKSKDVFSQPGLDVDSSRFFREHPEELPAKMWWQMKQTAVHLLNGGPAIRDNWADAIQVFLFALFVLTPPRGESRRQRAFRRLVLACLATSILAGSVFNLRWRHLYGFLPVVLLCNAAVLARLLLPVGDSPREPGARGAARRLLPVAGAVLLLTLLGANRILQDLDPPDSEDRQRNNYYQAVGEFLRKETGRSGVILTNAPGLEEPAALAWYGRRQMIELSDYTLQWTQAHQLSPVFVLSSARRADGPPPDITLPGFAQVARWEGGAGRAVLYRAAMPAAMP